MTPEQAAKLLEPFAPEQIGKLPRVICKACTEANKRQWGSTCDKHKRINCTVCGNWISEKHIHLDYVGHALTTKRLIDCDPEWTWEPVAFDANGAPALANGGLWIRMTVNGVTRLGWGDGPDIKQMISDAIRNAAMRFGVALDLWSKEDLHATQNAEAGPASQGGGLQTNSSAPKPGTLTTGEPPASAPSPRGESTPAAAAGPAESSQANGPAVSKNRRDALKARCVALQADGVSVADAREAVKLPLVDSCNAAQLEEFEMLVETLEAKLTAPFVEAPV